MEDLNLVKGSLKSSSSGARGEGMLGGLLQGYAQSATRQRFTNQRDWIKKRKKSKIIDRRDRSAHRERRFR